jgi:hypothetical protein
MGSAQEVPGCPCDSCREARRRRNRGKWSGYDYIDPKKVKSLASIAVAAGFSEKHSYLLCGGRLMGFILKSRKWGKSTVYPSQPHLKPDLTVPTNAEPLECNAARNPKFISGQWTILLCLKKGRI